LRNRETVCGFIFLSSPHIYGDERFWGRATGKGGYLAFGLSDRPLKVRYG
jgi:hypothetical protein